MPGDPCENYKIRNSHSSNSNRSAGTTPLFCQWMAVHEHAAFQVRHFTMRNGIIATPS